MAGVVTLVATAAAAQPPAPPMPRPGDDRPALPPIGQSPPASLTAPAQPDPGSRPRLSTGPRIEVKAFKITGNTEFSDAELAKVVRPWVRDGITTEDLLAVRDALTRHYILNGFINSGAILPDQEVTNGEVALTVIEGRLTRIAVQDARWFRPGYFRRRIELGDRPLKVADLEDRLVLLQQARGGRRLDANLAPGLQRGQSDLSLTVQERFPLSTRLEFSNHQAPSIGGERGQVTVGYESLTRNGDPLSISYGKTRGLSDVHLSYAFPLTARDLTLRADYRDGDSVVIEEPFNAVDIESRSTTYSLSLTQPFRRSRTGEWSVGAAAEIRQSTTSLLGRPFTFSEGAIDGKANVSVVRLFQSWTHRNATQVLASRLQVSVGVDAFGATLNSWPVPNGKGGTRRPADGRFLSALGQFQWARRLGWLRGTEAVARLDTQISRNPLLSIEQFAIGGHASVRGYRENQIVRDSGAVGSLELRLPLFSNAQGRPRLRIGPLFDIGTGWNRSRPTPDPQLISSAGVGWQLSLLRDRIAIQGAWAHGFQKVDTRGDLQDQGLHFQVSVTPW